MQRGSKYGAIAIALKGQAFVFADCKTNGGLDRHRYAPAPTTGVAIDKTEMAHDIDRKNPVFVKAT